MAVAEVGRSGYPKMLVGVDGAQAVAASNGVPAHQQNLHLSLLAGI
jgi:hypothetical protein